jgi:cytochrome oxidase Cu insertion factor (SCO1/SenC/PrrC family)
MDAVSAAENCRDARSTAAIGRPFTLTATDGTTVTDQTYRGKWMLIYFGYTSCPDAWMPARQLSMTWG